MFSSAVVVGASALLIRSGKPVPLAWSVALTIFAATSAALALWHAKVLPKPPEDHAAGGAARSLSASFVEGWRTFFQKPGIVAILGFILFFRLSETLLSSLATPFLKDPFEKGGAGLSPEHFAFVNVAGVVALLAGGVIGGVTVSRLGLRRMLWPMVAVMHLPNLAFLALSYAPPQDMPVVTAAVLVEKFGYGFGMCAIMLYLISVCTGERRVTHYALCSGFMILGAKLPAYFAGDIQAALGYRGFFLVVIAAIVPGVISTWFVRNIDPAFGKKA